MKRSRLAGGALAALTLALFLAPPVPAAPDSQPASRPAGDPGAADQEIKAEVPALSAFHEVIFELWHTAWPDKNVALIKELLPRVRTDFAAVRTAPLPGILRDKQGAWDEGLKRMSGDVDACETAAAANNDTALLDAVEQLHADFEAQGRIIRPHMRQLEAYHVPLYLIYHRYLPSEQIGPLKAGVDSLQAKCALLASASAPAWFHGDRDNLKHEIEVLCGETDKLAAAVPAGDWKQIGAAVETVHDQYGKILSLFE